MDSPTSSVLGLVRTTLLDKNELLKEFFRRIVKLEINKEIVDTFPGLRRNSNNWSRCLSELLDNWGEILSDDMSDIPLSDVLEDSVFVEFIDEKDSFFERFDDKKIAGDSALFKEHFEFHAFKKTFISMKKNEPEKLKELIVENTKKIYQNLIDVFTAIDESGII